MISNRTGTARLLKLAEFLKTLPRKRFDYTDWVGRDWKGKEDLSCGTTACALGWATTIPSIRRTGLRLLRSHDEAVGYVGFKDRRGIDPFSAGAEVFGITYYESTDLFSPGNSKEFDATPKQVAKKIEDFVKNRG